MFATIKEQKSVETVTVSTVEAGPVGPDGVPFSDFSCSEKARPDYGVTHKPQRLFNWNQKESE